MAMGRNANKLSKEQLLDFSKNMKELNATLKRIKEVNKLYDELLEKVNKLEDEIRCLQNPSP